MCAKRFGMALCAMLVLTGCVNNKNIQNNDGWGPTSLPQCSNGRDDDGDRKTDAADPECHWDGNAGNPASYVSSHDDERNCPNPPATSCPGPSCPGPSGPVPSGPGPFNVDMNSIRCPRAEFGEFRVSFSWSGSAGAAGYKVERRGGINSRGTWDFQNPHEPLAFVSFNGNSFVQSRVRPDFSYDYRVWAVNGFGQRLGDPQEFHACDAVYIPPPPPPPPPPPSSTTPPGGGGGTPPGGGNPPSGGACSGASAALPGLSTKGQSQGFAISAPAGCSWTLTSNNHHVVSVNPASGTGSGYGSVVALNAGTATVTFSGGGSASYTIR